MAALSLMRSLPFPVLRLSSEPARSIRFILPETVCRGELGSSVSTGVEVETVKVRIAWDRLDWMLRFVLAVERF